MAFGQAPGAKEHIFVRLFILESRMVQAGGDMAYGTALFTVRCINQEQSGTREVSALGVFEKKKNSILIS